MQTTLNDFLTAKGVTTNLKHKRSLAQAFGLPMDNGTDQQQNALLRALQAGEMGINSIAKESFKVEVAFDEQANAEFANIEDANGYRDNQNKQGKVCRVSRVTTISQVL